MGIRNSIIKFGNLIRTLYNIGVMWFDHIFPVNKRLIYLSIYLTGHLNILLSYLLSLPMDNSIVYSKLLYNSTTITWTWPNRLQITTDT